MALSDADWQAWLESEDKDPVVLVETEYVEGVGTVPVYWSDRHYVDKFNVSGNNYDPVIKGDVVIDEDPEGVTLLDIRVQLEDDILTTRFQAQELRVYFGDRSWARDDFRIQVTAVIEKSIRESPRHYVLGFGRVGQQFLDQYAILPGRPFLFGNSLNFSPLFETSTTYYFYSDSEKTIGYLADQGKTLSALDYSSSFSSNKQTLTVTTPPSGKLTGRFEGTDSISGILGVISGFCDVDIPLSAGISVYDTFDLGYVARDDFHVESVINQLVESFGGNIRMSRNLELEIFQFAEPGVSSFTFTNADIRGWIKQVGQDPVFNRVILGFQENHTIMSAEDFISTADLDTVLLQNKWRTVSSVVPSLENRKTFRQNTQIQTNTQAIDEVTRRSGLKTVPRTRWSMPTFIYALTVEVGDTVTVESDYYTFTTSGEDFLVIGNRKILTQCLCELTLWL